MEAFKQSLLLILLFFQKNLENQFYGKSYLQAINRKYTSESNNKNMLHTYMFDWLNKLKQKKTHTACGSIQSDVFKKKLQLEQ